MLCLPIYIDLLGDAVATDKASYFGVRLNQITVSDRENDPKGTDSSVVTENSFSALHKLIFPYIVQNETKAEL